MAADGARGRVRVYGQHAARAVIERRPDALLSATVLAGPRNARLETLAERLRGLGVPLEQVSRHVLDARAQGASHQGVILEVHPLEPLSLSDFEALVVRRARALKLLVLDQVEDPRNLGACLRTADAAGCDALVVPKARAAGLTPAAIKAAAGAAEAVPVVHVSNLVRTLKWLQDAGVWVVGTDAEAPRSLFDARLEAPLAIALGSEGRGLRRLTRETCDELVSIPLQGSVESLNVSVAAGIVLFEVLRQHRGEA
jgi:23S rRNA (guanosine2251-2'-O)-methyltransferase